MHSLYKMDARNNSDAPPLCLRQTIYKMGIQMLSCSFETSWTLQILKNPIWKLQKYLFIGKVEEKKKWNCKISISYFYLSFFFHFMRLSKYFIIQNTHQKSFTLFFPKYFLFLGCVLQMSAPSKLSHVVGICLQRKDRTISSNLHTAFHCSPHMSGYYNQYSQFCLIAEHIIWSTRKLVRYVGPQTVKT